MRVSVPWLSTAGFILKPDFDRPAGNSRGIAARASRRSFMEWPAPPSGKVVSPEAQTEEWIMKIAVLGVDLGNNVCSSVGFDEVGAVVLHRRSRRDTLIDCVGKLPPCIVAMEACCGAHHLGRLFAAQGHDVRLMSPEYMRPRQGAEERRS
jgi:hypothetical protein